MSDYTAEDLAYIKGMKIADACVDELREDNALLRVEVVGLKVYGERMDRKVDFWRLVSVALGIAAAIGWWAFWMVTR